MRNTMWRVAIGVVCGFLLLGCEEASDSSSALVDPSEGEANEEEAGLPSFES